MKKKLFIAIALFSAGIISSQNTSAQTHFGQSMTSNVQSNKLANYMAMHSDLPATEALPADDALSVTAKASSVRSLYMASEQFVFDNLGSLKKAFSVADIYFDLDKAEIRPDAMPALNYLVDLMTEHPEISVAVTSHTDSRMSSYNEKMNIKRAEAAISYLTSKGIGADRLSIDKHGRPAVANPCNGDASCTLAVQQLNRRTEFNIVYNGINLGQIN